ncbi:MAG: hypothetical protein KGZ25_12535, partial [Planctomycetes bacterium]|nr:hypothetical protein [Planctomycetota bacterium]
MVVVRMELLRYARQYGAYPDALKQLETEGVLPPGFTEGLEDMYVAAGQPYRKETASPQLLLRQMKYRPYERVFISGQARAFVYSSMDPVLIPRRQQYFYWDVRRGVERTNILLEHGLDPVP